MNKNNLIFDFFSNINSKLTTKTVWIFYIIFCVLVLFIAIFHEPWFDELLAWGVSKESLHNLLFFTPHYEGHPPLWHLILKPFSYFNVSPEIGLRIPNLIFIFSAVWLLMFKSPFPKLIKITLPFTYFIFYQLSIINRPYSIFCFALFLIAYLYKKKNEHPFVFISVILLFCLTSAYAIVFAAGIVLTWIIEILKEKNTFKILFTDKRLLAIFIYLIVNLALTIELIPAKDVYAVSSPIKYDYVIRFLYSCFGAISDSTITNLLNYSTVLIFNIDFKDFLKFSSNMLITTFLLKFWGAILCGVLINILLIYIFKKSKNLLLFLNCYLMFVFVIFSVYFWNHHLTLLFLFLVFMFWVVSDNNIQALTELVKKPIILYFLILTFCIQFYWCMFSSIMEIKYNYSYSRELVNYIKKNNLQNYDKFMSVALGYTLFLDKKTEKTRLKDVFIFTPTKTKLKDETLFPKNIINLEFQHDSTIINAYFNRNIFYNFNMDNPKRQYLFHKVKTDEEQEKQRLYIKSLGLPDLVLGNSNNFNWIFRDKDKPAIDLISENYRIMREFVEGRIFKDSLYYSETQLYMKKDLYYDKLKQDFSKK